jgi:ACS family tartrate transporter-like MFS transporter
MDEVLPRVVLTKVAWRLLPFLFVLYVINILDRINVSFARLQMLDDLQMNEASYALGAGIFYIGYFVFEVPSNLILSRTGARLWIGRIMISWGLTTCAMMAVRGPRSFYLLRILLGFAEAGFFPGIILYLTYWFPARERARAVALFMIGWPLTGALGSPISGAILQYLDHVHDLRGWQWLFLLEGLPAVALGVAVLIYLTDRPAYAHWLTAAERDWLANQVDKEEQYRQQRHGLTLAGVLTDGWVWLLILLYFTLAAGANANGFYLPLLLQTRLGGVREFQLGLLVAVPNVCAMLGMVVNGVHSDRTGERRWHVAVPAFLAAAGWTAGAFLEAPGWSLFAFTVAQAGVMSTLPRYWSLPTAFLSGRAAAGGIAWINALGNLGGFVGPYVIAELHDAKHGFAGGLLALAVGMVMGGALALWAGCGHSMIQAGGNEA